MRTGAWQGLELRQEMGEPSVDVRKADGMDHHLSLSVDDHHVVMVLRPINAHVIHLNTSYAIGNVYWGNQNP